MDASGDMDAIGQTAQTQSGGWRAFREQVETAGDNVYLKEWWRCMNELEEFGWLTNGGVHMDLPPVWHCPLAARPDVQ